MAILKSLSDRYPLAVAAFVKWITARNTLSPYTPYLRKPLVELPIDLLYGIMIPFFEENGVLVNSKYTTKGRQRIIVYIKRMSGTYDIIHKGPLKNNTIDAMTYAVSAATRVMNTKLNKAFYTPVDTGDTEVFVGLDVESLLSDARKEQIQCLL